MRPVCYIHIRVGGCIEIMHAPLVLRDDLGVGEGNRVDGDAGVPEGEPDL